MSSSQGVTKEKLLTLALSVNPDVVTDVDVSQLPGGKFIVVQTLPPASEADPRAIYLLRRDKTEEKNIYDEYLRVEPTEGEYSWEKIGSTNIDLSGYVTDVKVNEVSQQKENGVVHIKAIPSDAIDTQLKTAGKAADAKAVGDELDKRAYSSDLEHVIEYSNNGNNSVAIGQGASTSSKNQKHSNAAAIGYQALAKADNSVAMGQTARTDDDNSVVISANNVGDEYYAGHGFGTLNLASRKGMRGIFFQHMNLDFALAFLLSNIPEITGPGVVNAYNSFLIEYSPASPSGLGYSAGDYFCHNGRLYKVLSRIDDGLAWEEISASKYKEVTLREVLFASPAFTGAPTAPTPTADDNSTNVATTAFVKSAISGISVTPLSGRNFDFATTQGVMDALKATIEALGGSVTNAPTPPAQNNQTQGE